jgi:cytochrome c biogenesis protein CcdA
MYIARTKGVGIGPIKFDGWEVVAGVGLAALILSTTIDESQELLRIIGIALLAVWLLIAILKTLLIKRSASASDARNTSGGV